MPAPAPLFVQRGLEPIVEWEMLLCFASSRILSSAGAAAKLLTGSLLKLAQPRGSGAPVSRGQSGEEGQGPGLKHHCSLGEKILFRSFPSENVQEQEGLIQFVSYLSLSCVISLSNSKASPLRQALKL